MDDYSLLILIAASGALAYWYYRNSKEAMRRRQQFILGYEFPSALTSKLLKRFPHLDDEQDCKQVFDALRQFFLVRLEDSSEIVMPSKYADFLWREFSKRGNEYEGFCEAGFGDYLKHVPVRAAAAKPAFENAPLRRTWFRCCRVEGIDPNEPDILPSLFSVDEDLGIPRGFIYNLERMKAFVATISSAGPLG